jgi:ferredoxin
MTLRIAVDDRLCSGQGRCYSISSELLDCDDEGFVTIRGTSIEVPAGMEGAARKAVNACPEDAISVTESEPADAGQSVPQNTV